MFEKLTGALHLESGRSWYEHDEEDLNRVSSADNSSLLSYEPRHRTVNQALPMSSTSLELEEGLSLQFEHLSLLQEAYPDSSPYTSRLLLIVKQLTIIDRIKASLVNIMLTDFESPQLPREVGTKMARVEMISVKTPGAQGDNSSEEMLHVSLLPLRLNVDQDALNFVVKFFSFAPRGSAAAQNADLLSENWQHVSVHEDGVSDVTTSRMSQSQSSHSTGAQNSSPPMQSPGSTVNAEHAESTEDGSMTYFKIVKFNPIVLHVDYEPKHVSFGQLFGGDVSQLAHVVPIRNANLVLVPITIRGMHLYLA